MTAQTLAYRVVGAPAPGTIALPYAHLDVRREADASILDAWSELERTAPCSIYQTRAWLLPWIGTLADKAGVAPVFILARDADARPIALLCLGLGRRGPVRTATFLGGRDSNFNMMLARPGVPWCAPAVEALLAAVADALGAERPDAFLLLNQPRSWAGSTNHLTALPAQPSPSAAYGLSCEGSAEAFFARAFSKERRKKLRRKEARLAELGPIRHQVAASADARAAVIDAFLHQRVQRFRDQGIASDFDDPRMRAFIERAATPGLGGVGLELHALTVGERIVAVYGGAAHGGQWSGMFNSFDTDLEIARSSPGDLLLMRIIAAQTEHGVRRLDLGIGEASYKEAFCDTAIPLVDVLVPVTAKGRVYLWLYGLARLAKRAVKRNRPLFDRVKKLRGALGRRSAGRA